MLVFWKWASNQGIVKSDLVHLWDPLLELGAALNNPTDSISYISHCEYLRFCLNVVSSCEYCKYQTTRIFRCRKPLDVTFLYMYCLLWWILFAVCCNNNILHKWNGEWVSWMEQISNKLLVALIQIFFFNLKCNMLENKMQWIWMIAC